MLKKRKQPKRVCIGCGELKDKKNLIRIVHTPEDEYRLDSTGKQNGRGAYICRSAQCMAKAIKSKGLERAFRSPVPAETYQTLREEMDALAKEG